MLSVIFGVDFYLILHLTFRVDKTRFNTEVEMFYVIGLKKEFSLSEDQRTPNAHFWKYYEALAGTTENVA
ncbi:hypothetical protein [Leptospira levettii]|uniref:Uncharacterized protein n=1 Tax=Leptospira levettii TaxID=2023178 RepID=A0ABY2MTM7_9LEPT|nr:hypothetical protein [Leptospira levettii]TGL75231.1 hypothetical protein EHQ60_00470 [Leptospira levettii]